MRISDWSSDVCSSDLPSPSQGQTGCGFALARRVTGPLSGGPNVENGMDRAQKTEAVTELNRTFNEVGVVVVTRNLGLTVAQSTELRIKMREAGATYKVSKNKLDRKSTRLNSSH